MDVENFLDGVSLAVDNWGAVILADLDGFWGLPYHQSEGAHYRMEEDQAILGK